MHCKTKQNRTDQDVTSFQPAEFLVNGNPTVGNVNNFSSHINYHKYISAFVKVNKVAGYANCEVAIEGTDSSVSKSIYGISLPNIIDKINTVHIRAKYITQDGAVVNGFVEGSTFECYYR